MTEADQFYHFILDCAEDRTRVDQELLWRALRAIHPEITVTPAARAKVRDLLDQLVLNGLIETPKGRDRWDQSSFPILPKWIRLPRQVRRKDKIDLKTIPWAPELHFLSNTRSDIPLADLLTLQRFFAEGGRNLPIVPTKERSLQIFDDEKRLDSLYSSSVIFAAGCLTLDQLRCETCAEPLGWKRGPLSEGPFIVIENAATWNTYCRWNEQIKFFSAVIYGGGNRFVDSIAFLEEISREVGGYRRTFYFGDIDFRGLSIPQRANDRALQLALPTIEPHFTSYKWLLEIGRPISSTADVDLTTKRELCEWLGDLSEMAWTVLSDGKRLAQENIGWQFLQNQKSATGIQ